MWMRGGTSKGGYFLAADLPADEAQRNAFLLRAMGSPDIRQIDGMGGGDPLTSKVAVVRKSSRDGVDVDYLFLQVYVEQPIVTDSQNCGNILAGVGPFAIERGLLKTADGITPVTIYMENSGQIAVARVATPGGNLSYLGNARIDGVPGPAAAIPIEFKNTAGSSCGALLPSGRAVDVIDGIEVTMIDNGMPCVVLRAEDMGISGDEAPEVLEADDTLRSRLESIRLQCGPLMNLGDVAGKSVPKMTMISAAQKGGAVNTRTFIPHRCHKTIGVLGAVSVATACLIKNSCASDLADTGSGAERNLSIEHPTGEMTVVASLDAQGDVARTAVLRTARKLMDGVVFA
jgi:4-oxalomesaconate tautomerase